MCRHGPGRARWLACLAFAAVACDRGDAPPRGSVAESVRGVEPTADTTNWVRELGRALVVPLESESTGVVLFPAAPSARLITSSRLVLLGPAGDTVTTRATLVVSDSQVCGEAPTVRLGNSPANPWSVALIAGGATPVRTDSIEALPPGDSVRVVGELARLASALPMSRESRFAGLPFVVLSARRFDANGRQVVAAHLLRRLPQEATPFEEHTLLVAERDTADHTGRFSAVFHERSEGTEETADHFEILSAVRAGAAMYLLIARDQDARTTYEILERARAGWRSRWARTLAC
jgi:hypothetical protein